MTLELGNALSVRLTIPSHSVQPLTYYKKAADWEQVTCILLFISKLCTNNKNKEGKQTEG
jgi:hypothetical protein